MDFNLGLGLGTTFYSRAAYTAPGYSFTRIPTISASGEYAVTNAIGVGGYFGYTSFKWTYASSWYNNGGWHNYVDTYKYSFFILGARGAYHFDEFIKIDKLDCYAGLMLGYNIAKATYSTTDPSRGNIAYTGASYGGFAYSVFAGARYRFTDNIGVFGELGYGISILNIGLNVKI